MPGEPFLRVIEGAAERKAAGGAQRKADPPPRPRSRPRKPTAPDKPDDAALAATLAELLTMPAIPAAMVLNCDYCRDHFINEGPKAARELVALSITSPALRGALESLHTGWSRLTIAGVLAGYMAKPLLHHVAPAPMLETVGPVLRIPPRPEKPKHDHRHKHDATDPQAEHDRSPAGPSEDDAPEDQYSGAPFPGIDAA